MNQVLSSLMKEINYGNYEVMQNMEQRTKYTLLSFPITLRILPSHTDPEEE